MDSVIGPIIAAKLLLSTEAYELVGEGVEWTAFLILFVSWSMTVSNLPDLCYLPSDCLCGFCCTCCEVVLNCLKSSHGGIVIG